MLTTGNSTLRALALAFLALPTGVLLAGEATADSAAAWTSALPSARAGAAAAWDGTTVLVMGGRTASGSTSEILRLNPTTGLASAAAFTLPSGRSDAAVAWANGAAIVVGGTASASSTLADIVRVNPTAGTATVVGTMPSPRAAASVAWTGTHLFIFGGSECVGTSCSSLASILRYDPGTGTVLPMNSLLPTRRNATAAAYDGRYVYVFGGVDFTGILADVLRYDPATDSIVTLSTRLPTARSQMGAFFDGKNAFLIGGQERTARSAEVLKFDPATAQFTVMSAPLPTARRAVAAAWTGSIALLAGGFDGANLAQVVRWSPAPAAPGNPAATPGAGIGRITVSWTPPPANTYSDLTGYRVYRAPVGGAFALLGSSATTPFVDATCAVGATCRYRVAGVNANRDEGALSAEVSAVSPRLPGEPRAVATTSGPPRGAITISWEPPADTGGVTITSYRVYGGASAGALAFVGISPAASFTQGGLADGDVRYYRVSAVNGAGEGPASGVVSGRAPVLPSEPRDAVAEAGPDPGEITLTWQPPAETGGVALTYNVYRGPETGREELLVSGVSGLRFVDAPTGALGLPGVLATWHYRVTAVNVVGEGPRSAPACASPSPWPGGAIPPVANPCPLPQGWRERRLASQSVTPTLVGPPASPPVNRDALHVDGAPRPDGAYEVNAQLGGAPPVPAIVLDGAGAIVPAVRLDLVSVPSMTLRPSATVSASMRYDPTQAPCRPSAIGACVPSVTSPVDPVRFVEQGGSAALVVDVRVTDPSGRVVAQQAVLVPYAGQASNVAGV